MITVNVNKINTINQISYENIINSISFHQIICTCGHKSSLTKHGYYNRKLKLSGGLIVELSILRVKCSICGKTHAVLPSFVVPYSQILLEDHISVICNYEDGITDEGLMNDNPLIDESNTAYIRRNYKKYWQQRFKAFGLNIKQDINEIVISCFRYFDRQFMQIKCTQNILFIPTHIT
ncbi:MAG: DUF6431 domain-containing protein [Lachnospiraceae bacterium]|nr:DUF6431 domain-containing protein [Lachnospiraceae bacterium]